MSVRIRTDSLGRPCTEETRSTRTRALPAAPLYLQPRCGRRERPGHQVARSAAVTGTRAALNAGRNPPIAPMASAHPTPSNARAGVTARWKLEFRGLAERPLNKAQETSAPITAPGRARTIDSDRMAAMIGTAPNPSARKVASSRRRLSTIAYSEFAAPMVAAIAMIVPTNSRS